LVIRRGKNLALDFPEALHFLFEFDELFSEPRFRKRHRFQIILASCRVTIRRFDLAQITRDAFLDLFEAPLQLAFREVVVAAVDGS
jgi:hypothetical protein